jgi:hypothetical protein
MTVRSAMELGPLGHVRQTVTFDPTDFRPLAATVDRSVAARVERAEVRVVGDSILGSTTDGDGTTRAIANALPEGAVIGEMQEVALWAADLSSTRALSVVVAGQTDGTSRVMRARVLGEREITVPAGTFQVWEVEFQVDGPPQRAFLSREAPHLLVRLGGEGAPLTVELRSAGGR